MKHILPVIVTCLLALSAATHPTLALSQDAQAYIVNSLDDHDDGFCDSDHCSLREAIAAANRSPALDAIHFDLPSLGPYTIRLQAPLPLVADPVLIDGWTQPGFAGLPLIEVVGEDLEAEGVTGLLMAGGRSAVRGLQIKRFTGYGIIIQDNGGNVIQGNVIGGNEAGGIWINNVPANRIGGEDPATGNLIASNGGPGVAIQGPAATGNLLRGNVIGLDPTGALPLGNALAGVAITSAPANTIGPDNVIDANPGHGIAVTGSGAVENVITGNLIGSDLGNAGAGVLVGSGASNNHIGDQNVIANNVVGVLLRPPSTGNTITANAIFANQQAGIDLEPSGLTANDALDADGGTNNQQNFPLLIRLSDPGSVEGTLESARDRTYQVEVFHSPACAESGYGEGETLVAALQVTTDDQGKAVFNTALDGAPVGGVLAATATDLSTGDTSEFSLCLALPLSPTPTTVIEPTQTATSAPELVPPTPTLTPTPAIVAEAADFDGANPPAEVEPPPESASDNQSRQLTWLFVGIASTIPSQSAAS